MVGRSAFDGISATPVGQECGLHQVFTSRESRRGKHGGLSLLPRGRYSPTVLTLGAFLVLMDRISVTLSRTSIHPEVTRHAAHRCNNRRNIAKKRAVPPQRPSYVPSELQLGGDPRRCGSDVAGQTSGSLPTRSLNLPTVTCPSVFLLFRINAGGQTSAHIAKPQGAS
jgi:hypothetical protein